MSFRWLELSAKQGHKNAKAALQRLKKQNKKLFNHNTATKKQNQINKNNNKKYK